MRARPSLLLLVAVAFCGACASTTEVAGPDPIVAVDGPALDAVLVSSATASLVTLELRITNMQTVPQTVHFGSGQQYDFRVRRLNGGIVWVWSADKAFTAASTARTIAPAETVIYTATWTPTEHGSFTVDGWLTSSSHAAMADAGLAIP